MKIDIFGSLGARIGEVSVLPTAAKQRRILALLAVSQGMVTTNRLIEEVWGDRPPKSAVTAIQTYVLGLRSRIGDAGVDPKQILVTRHGGYEIELAVDDLDALLFEYQVQRGNRLLIGGHLKAAVDAFDSAEKLWRNGPFEDLQPGPHLVAHAVRLQEIRFGAIESRVEIEVRCGRHHKALSELSVLVAQYPFHENFHAHYIFALHQSGRRDEALVAYKRVRDSLRRELGLEPSPRLRHLERDILSAENSDPGANVEWLSCG